MKKSLIIFILATLLISICSTASATNINLSMLTDNELLVLHQQVLSEISSREINNTIIYPGYYEVGIDIKASTYLVNCIKSEAVIITFENLEKYLLFEKYRTLYPLRALQYNKTSTQVKESQFTTLKLNDGEVIFVRYETDDTVLVFKEYSLELKP